MRIRAASPADFESLYRLGRATPELRVSREQFMAPDELRWAMGNRAGVFLVADERGKLVGFVYANAKDMDRPFKTKWACLVYLAVAPGWRRQGIGSALYAACEARLRAAGVNRIYGWARADSPAIAGFVRKAGFAQGHRFVWVDKRLGQSRSMRMSAARRTGRRRSTIATVRGRG